MRGERNAGSEVELLQTWHLGHHGLDSLVCPGPLPEPAMPAGRVLLRRRRRTDIKFSGKSLAKVRSPIQLPRIMDVTQVIHRAQSPASLALARGGCIAGN